MNRLMRQVFLLFLNSWSIPSAYAFARWTMDRKMRPFLTFLLLSWSLPSAVSFTRATAAFIGRASGNRTARLFAEKETLTFAADFHLTSERLQAESKDDVSRFMRTTACRNHFLSAGGTSNVNEEELTPKLLEKWNDLCDYYGSDFSPEEGDSVVASESNVKFPGLILRNTVFSGVKLVEQEGFPRYRCALIAEKRTVTGLPLFVWVFNKLTGASPDDVYSPSNGKASSVISIVEKDGGYAFHFDVKIVIKMEFPKALVNILPFSKEKMEERGTTSVKKAVSQDMEKAMNGANEAFLNWHLSESVAV
jgi:hypothetical protein